MIRVARLCVLFLVCVAVASAFNPTTASAPIVDPCKSSVSASMGIGLVCPAGDGDPLSAIGSTISVTARDIGGVGVPGIPRTDMWLVGCNDGLLLCGGSSASNADAPTDALGQSTFSNEPIAGGCDTGLYVVIMGYVIQHAGTCVPHCLLISMRSPDYKSAGAPGPAPCAGDIRCPDSKVTMADYSWFASHYRRAENPGAPYHACADYTTPFGNIGLPDYSKFVVHYIGTGHQCSI
jgi:hypothetical protein